MSCAYLGTYFLLEGIRRTYPYSIFNKKLYKTTHFNIFNNINSFIVIFVIILQAFFILMSFQHYSVDIYISIILVTLILSNDHLLNYLYNFNILLSNQIEFVGMNNNG